MSRAIRPLLLAIAGIVAVGALAVFAIGTTAAPAASSASPSATAATSPSAIPSPTPSPSPTATPSQPSPSSTASASPSTTASPSASRSPAVVPAPLTGLPISAALARRPVIAVMVDDQFLARPQSGFSSASVVWQAPAEGGIPRYMMLFQEGDPKSVGPVRSARLYFISWAGEWRAVYVHAGGSPQALRLLRGAQGRGRVVYNADDFKYEGRFLFRTRPRVAPHNLYTDGSHLRGLARAVGAKPRVVASSWQFAPDVPVAARPTGGQIVVPYQENRIVYRYDRASNRYLRSVTNESRQIDAATKARVGPKNVVVMYVRFAPLRDGTTKGRLEARVTGSGKALISTNGKTVVGTWRKASFAAPTLLFGRDGSPVTLTAGQTFVQVVPVGTKVSVHDGKPAAATASPTPAPTASPTPAPTGFDRSVSAAAI